MDETEFNKKYEELKKSKFKQQKLMGWRPIPTISCITIIYLSFSLFFIILGIIILVFNGQVSESKYSFAQCDCDYDYNPVECSLTIDQKMSKPIMIYYELEDFNQNFRIYMDSKSEKQLEGEEVSDDELQKVCENALFKKEILHDNSDDIANPCGLIAKSYYYYFEKKFDEWKINGVTINVKIDNIAYKLDIDKIGKVEYNQEKHYINITDEHFYIWMRTSPFVSPRKLWGIIEEQDIEKGSSISFKITNTRYFNPSKQYIIFSTRNVFGGPNKFLGMCYIIFGILCLITSIIVIISFSSFHKKK